MNKIMMFYESHKYKLIEMCFCYYSGGVDYGWYIF